MLNQLFALVGLATPFAMAFASIPLTPKRSGDSLRVLIIGRISTAHQQLESIDASYRYVEEHLRRIYDGPIVITHLGERASGMLSDRATICQADELIAAGSVDLVITEDLSRIYRNPRHQYAFVQNAVDAGVRVICIADNLDTADDHWELMLTTAGLRHGLVVTDIRRRVRRTATHSFQNGGMVQKIRFGYRKLTKEEAASGQHGPKGLRLAKVESCTPIIQEMKLMVLAGKPYSSLCQWLKAQRIQPGPYAKDWTARQVIDLLRDPILHGERTFRNVKHLPIMGSGKYRRERNANPERLVQPELAHLTVEEHEELLTYMDARAAGHKHQRGAEHPRHRLPRSKAIWPAQHLACGICCDPMYAYERGQLKCNNTFNRGSQQCWCHVQVHAEQVRAAVVPWLLQNLIAIPGASEALLEACWLEIQRSNATSRGALQEAERELHSLELQADRLAQAIAEGGEIPAVLSRLNQIQQAMDAVRVRISALQCQPNDCKFPIDRAALDGNPLPALLELARSSYEFADLLKQVITHIKVVPVQDLHSGQVRPRIKVSATFCGVQETDENSSSIAWTCEFDVFERRQFLQHLNEVRDFRQQQPTATQTDVAEALGIHKMTVKRTLNYLRLMDDPDGNEPGHRL